MKNKIVNKMKKFLVTCDPGVEDIAKEEIAKKIKKARIENFFDFQGKLIVYCKSPKKLIKLHSIHHIIELKKVVGLKKVSLAEIYNTLKRVSIGELRKKKSFRITSYRYGRHNFTSMQIQDVAGRAIQEKYRKKVDLKNYDVNIRVDVIGDLCLIGLQHTKESLYKRFVKKFNHRAAIKSTLAYAMIRLANIKKGDILLDPMCGSGTIPLEAASLFKNRIKIIAGDINEKCILGSIENARLNKLDKYITFLKIDARKLEKFVKKVNKIVVNPPYGVKSGKKKNLKSLYRKFLCSVEKVLAKDGRLVVITLRANLFRNLINKNKAFKIVHERVVESGGLYPHMFVIEKI